MKNVNNYPLWTAVVTPMHTDSTIDFESLEKVLKNARSGQKRNRCIRFDR